MAVLPLPSSWLKNITGENDVSPTRKFRKLFGQLIWKRRWAKTIEMYMNTIYFGAGCHGVQTAANYYFRQGREGLTLEQCASLAGVVKAPTTYNPATNYEKTRAPGGYFNQNGQAGYISQQECDEAKGRNLNVKIGEVKKDKEDVKVQELFCWCNYHRCCPRPDGKRKPDWRRGD